MLERDLREGFECVGLDDFAVVVEPDQHVVLACVYDVVKQVVQAATDTQVLVHARRVEVRVIEVLVLRLKPLCGSVFGAVV